LVEVNAAAEPLPSDHWFARQAGRAARSATERPADGADLLGPPTVSGRLGPTLGDLWAKRLEIGILIESPITECLTWEEAAPWKLSASCSGWSC